MFTINDFINLLKYFKGTTVEIDEKLIISAESALATTTSLFNDNIDTQAHLSDDYKRLKSFLIPWYSSIKSFINIQKTASDIRSLPESHLNTLLNSFGFTDALDHISAGNKVDFFYDLVNLYKIKGTPEAIERLLEYFGIPDIELIEYWLQYDSNGRLIFHPEKVNKQIEQILSQTKLSNI